VQALLVICLHPAFSLGLFFDPEDGGYMYLRNFPQDTRCENLKSYLLYDFCEEVHYIIKAYGGVYI
jgi:hypothetical protein